MPLYNPFIAENVRFQLPGADTSLTDLQSKVQSYHVSLDADFGAIGDGVADDGPAFADFNSWATGLSANALVTLELSRGSHYMAPDPAWPINIPKLVVNGNGCAIQNSAAVNTRKMLLMPSWGLIGIAGPIFVAVPRYLINTTAVGDTQIVCTTAAEAGNFAVGEMLMIASVGIQWGGFPPNYKYFEFKTVKTVNAGTGVITLEERVEYVHKSNSPYLAAMDYVEGRAHIEKIEATSLWNIDHTYNDIQFIKNVVDAAGAVQEATYMIGRSVTLNNCHSPYILSTIADINNINNCVMTEAGEFDKLVKHLNINGGTFEEEIQSATSVVNLRANAVNFDNGYGLCAQRMSLIDCNVQAAAQANVALFTAYGYCESLEILGGNHEYYPSYSTNTGQTNSVTMNGGTVDWDGSSGTLTLDISASTTIQEFAAQCFEGQIIEVSGTSGGQDLPKGIFGVITNVTGSLDTQVIEVEFNAILAGTEVVTVFTEPRYVNIQNDRDYVKFQHTTFERNALKLTSFYEINNSMTYGRISKIKVDVLRAYTGPDGGNVILSILSVFPVYADFSKVIDLKTVGMRECSFTGNAGWSGANGESAGANIPAGSYSGDFCTLLYAATNVFTTTSEEQNPIVNIYVEFESPYNL